ncbi:MAG: hypothetical protein MUF78_05170 [Candidatus Edwardsbacteria bacterium]|jgi:hypothetical protein|nr:hypothetical protein [Candidatus Edwardsbacteria bacterium]
MRSGKLTRAGILAALRGALEPKSYIMAMWEGGAAAFGRVDRWSDIDLMVAAKPGATKRAAGDIERVLRRLSPFSARLPAQHPNWPDMIHTFYKLRDADEYLMVDVAVMPHDSRDKLLEPEIHGVPLVHFDKARICRPARLDRAAFRKGLEQRRDRQAAMFEVAGNFVRKELNRGNPIEAAYNYQMILDLLVEALRMRHGPHHYNFRGRYVHYELPAPVLRRLQPLFFVKGAADLGRKERRVRQWFRELTAS